MNILYHGSGCGGIDEFLPLTHFGTRQSAIDRMRTRGFASRFLYECSIFEHGKIIRVEDPKAVKPDGLLVSLSKAKAFYPYQDEEANWKACSGVRKELVNICGGREVNYASARKKIADFLASYSIESIVYINEVEDVGSETWVFVKPNEKVRIRNIIDLGPLRSTC